MTPHVEPASESAQAPAPDPALAPTLVAVVDRGAGTARILSSPEAERGVAVVRDGAVTVDYVSFDLPHGAREADVVAAAAAACPAPTPRRAWEIGAGAATRASVVICTLGRTPLLVDAVRAALAQEHPSFEVVVVDNEPATGAVRALLAGIDDARLRVVDEPRAGLSRARNRGVAAATGEVVAFTDDDAVTDPRWLVSLLDVLAAGGPAVGAATGPVFPARLVEPAQIYFEARGGFPKQLTPRVWHLDAAGAIDSAVARLGLPGQGGPLFPYATARVGAGVSMAYTRAALAALGSFDEALGAGTPTGGGEDLDAFARVLRAGLAIVTTPDAVLHHTHRQDVAGLEKQTYGDGTGMASLLTKTVLRDPRAALALAGRAPRVARRLAPGAGRVQAADAAGPVLPPGLVRRELAGILRGPGLYLQARAAVRRDRQAPEAR